MKAIKSNNVLRVAALVPARSGSEGLVDKNGRNFAGEPLLMRTLKLAKELSGVDLILFSSDSEKYLRMAESLDGITLRKRPSRISESSTPMSAVIRDACEYIQSLGRGDFDLLLLLDVTNPLRTREIVERALDVAMGLKDSYDGVVAISKPHFNPAWVTVLSDRNGVITRWQKEGSTYTSRQQAPEIFRMNGLYYIWRFEKALRLQDPWLEGGKYLGCEESDHQGISIDTIEDFQVAETLYAGGFVSGEESRI